MSAMQLEQLKALLVNQWPPLRDLLDDTDLSHLWTAKFRNVASIDAASGATLLALPLAQGIVAVLKPATGGQETLTAATVDLIEHATLFLCGRPGDELPSQCGFFFSSTGVLTTEHGLPKNARIGTSVLAYSRRTAAQAPESPNAGTASLQKITLKVEIINKGLDYAVLRSPVPHRFLQPRVGLSWRELQLSTLYMCSFSISTIEQLEDFDSSVALLQGRPIRMSRNRRHLVYDCACAPGDSGAAVVLCGGNVIGMHTEGINHMRERVRQAKTVKERLSSVEASLDSAVESVSQGAIALLAVAFSQVV